MASSFEKSVKGGTKIKLAAPKSKYVEHILVATHAGEQGVAEVFRVLQNRLRDSTWTIVFKSLIIVHFMIREGEPNVTLKYLSNSPQRKLAINNFTEVQTQGRNIRSYAEYLVQRASSFGATKIDHVRTGEGRLKRLSVEKGLLRETESVQDQIRALLRCDFLSNEPENDISLTAFRLLTMDLLALFHVVNEGMINILEHYFELSRPDAERSANIYRAFVKQADNVVKYLQMARNYEHVTRLEIPKIKHAPTTLLTQLEDDLKNPDFETVRRQYVAERQAKKGGRAVNGTSKPVETKSSVGKSDGFPSPKAPAASTTQTKGPAPDLIDFFESIEQNQTQMNTNPFQQPQFTQQAAAAQPQPTGFMQQPTGFAQQPAFVGQNTGASMPQPQSLPQPQPQPFGPMNGQSTNPFQQLQQQQQQPQQLQQIQPNFTGAGFGGYTPQPQPNRFTPGLMSIPQNSVAPFQQPQPAYATGATDSLTHTNPFRQSMMPNATGTSTSSFGSSSTTPTSMSQSTNPFAKPANQSPVASNSPFSPPTSQFSALSMSSQQPHVQPLMPAATGTNPFARNTSPAQSSPFASSPGVTANVTGSTNPFRQSHFVNQQTGQGWQSGPQGTIGGMSPEQLQTMPIFPRPGQANGQQQQQTGWPGQ